MTPKSADDDYDCDYQDVDDDYDYQDDDDNYVPMGWYEKQFDNNDDNNQHTNKYLIKQDFKHELHQKN